ncbi:MAG: hypothetical protein HQ596_07980 [Candidatus Saganbacteria bacterium]|nr:hypothetical protein [Candidatus Saganbacteria bacterium]
MPTEIKRDFFKDKHAIFVVTHLSKASIELFMNTVLPVLNQHKDVVLAVIDSRSSDDIIAYLKSIKHDQIVMEFLDKNIGKAQAANDFIAKYINHANLPKTVWSMDPDILFDLTSFDYLLEAVQNLEGIGVLGMRYKNNECNPEMNMWLPPKNVKAKNGKTYSLVSPVMCCVAGPILAMKGKILSGPLDFKLFPKKFVRVYGGDDSAIDMELKKHGYKNAYLNGTLATHLRSGNKLAPEIKNVI